MDDFFEHLLQGPAGRPQHPDFMKLADVVLRHDGPTTDPTTMHTFSMVERVNQDIDFESLNYMLKGRVTTYIDMIEAETGVKIARDLAILAGALWLDAFMIGVEWQKAKKEPAP